jgi:hypothetical protein
MKNLLFISILLFVITACKKAPAESVTTLPPPASNQDFVGEWTWIRSIGGITGGTFTPENGLERKLTFTNTSMKVEENGKVLGATDFTTYKGKSLILNVAAPFMKIETASCTNCKMMETQMYRFSTTQDTLFLSDDVYDGFEHAFVKKRTDGFSAATYTGIDPKLCPSPCCGGYLLNINGVTYQTSAMPNSLNFDDKKIPQKLLLKFEFILISSCSRAITIKEAKRP